MLFSKTLFQGRAYQLVDPNTVNEPETMSENDTVQTMNLALRGYNSERFQRF